MEKYETGFDLLNKNLEKMVKTQLDSQNARNTFQAQITLAKIKNQWAQQAKTGDRQNKFAMDLALEKEKARMPFQAYQEFQSGQGNPGGAPNVTMGPDAKMRVLKLKDMAEQIYMKPPETWTPQEKNIVAQYISFAKATKGGNAPLFSNDNPTVEPVTQPVTQPTTTMRVKEIGSGQTGTINVSEFDPAKYEKI